MDGTVKRGRGRGRGTRARGRGRGRGKKAAVVVSSDEEISCDRVLLEPSIALMEDVIDGDTSTGSGSGQLTIIESAIEDVAMSEINKENENDCVLEPVARIPAIDDAIIIAATTATTSHIEVMPPSGIMQIPVEEPTRQLPPQIPTMLPQTIDMESDISQLEAPTFTTISRGPPEPMLRLKWDHKVNLIGEKVLNPMIHCCDQCDKPILLYGRMIPCKHVFCLKCARTEPIKICPRCNDKVLRVEQSGLGMVFMCTHGGSRYGNTGCRRTYLSQRDLQAHINHRHVTQMPLPPPMQQQQQSANELKHDQSGGGGGVDSHKARKLSDSSASTTIQSLSTMLTQRPQQMRIPSGIGTIQPPGNISSGQGGNTANITGGSGGGGGHSHSTLTLANLARINTANASDCHQGKVALHQTLKKTPISQSMHQQPETVADASYYSSVLNSFGSTGSGGNSGNSSSVGPNSAQSNTAASVGYGYDHSAVSTAAQSSSTQQQQTSHQQQSSQNSWQANQYYR